MSEAALDQAVDNLVQALAQHDELAGRAAVEQLKAVLMLEGEDTLEDDTMSVELFQYAVAAVLAGNKAVLALAKLHMHQQDNAKTLADALVMLAAFIKRAGTQAAPFAKQVLGDCFMLSRAPVPNPLKTAAFAPMFAVLEMQAVNEMDIAPATIAEAYIFDVLKSGTKTTTTSKEYQLYDQCLMNFFKINSQGVYAQNAWITCRPVSYSYQSVCKQDCILLSSYSG
jgi:hypothetical protein